MHVDESKKFDKRNLEKNFKNGIIAPKDYEAYLNRLPDASDKIFIPGEGVDESEEEHEFSSTKKGVKKKTIRG